VYGPDILSSTQLSLTDLPEGILTWSVSATNGASNSLSTTRTLIIDHTAPIAPTLTSPANNFTLSSNAFVPFSWSRESPTVSEITDQIVVYSDTSNLTVEFQLPISGTSYTHDSLAAGNYWWQVQSIDAAGNQSAWSDRWEFVVP